MISTPKTIVLGTGTEALRQSELCERTNECAPKRFRINTQMS